MTGDIPDTSPSFSTAKNMFNHLDRKDDLMFDIKLEPTFEIDIRNSSETILIIIITVVTRSILTIFQKNTNFYATHLVPPPLSNIRKTPRFYH